MKKIDMQSYPMVIIFGYKDESNEKKLVFIGRQGEIHFEMDKYREEFIRLLSLCNGQRTLLNIHERLSEVPLDDFLELVSIAEEREIITESRELYLRFHKDSSIPMQFARTMSPQQASDLIEDRKDIPLSQEIVVLASGIQNPLLGFCRNRKSVRSFKKEALTFYEVSGVLEAMYTIGEHRSVPSAGQLYPLEIYVAIMIDGNDLKKGVYQYDPEKKVLYFRKNLQLTDAIIARILNSYDAQNAGMVVFVAADLERQNLKYSNRSYRFALIETGHVAQNAYLFCSSVQDLGVLEYGGFQDDIAAKFLGLDYPKQAVLSVLIFGHPDHENCEITSFAELAWNLSEQLVGEGKPIEYVLRNEVSSVDHLVPGVQFVTKYRQLPESAPYLLDEEDCFGLGFSPVSDEAMIKSIAEAYERHVSGKVRIDRECSANQIDQTWLDPRLLVPHESFAFERYGWEPFNPASLWQWIVGKRHSTQKDVFVPIDLVFYPLVPERFNRKLCYVASSNGVATYSNFQVAQEKAFLELIERDALMVTWFSKRPVTALPQTFLPVSIQSRLHHWEQLGWHTKILNLTLDSVPVVCAVIFSPEKYPAFVAGAAAHSDIQVAITKAWDEAETFLINWSARKEVSCPKIEEVYAPLDHGKLYFHSENMHHIQWLLDANEELPVFEKGNLLNKAFEKFDPVFIDMNSRGSGDILKVVRAISEKLLPINFGWSNEHKGHQRFHDLNIQWNQEFPSFPHFFA